MQPGLSEQDLKILNFLAEYPQHTAQISHLYIAKQTELSMYCVKKSLNKLKIHGHIFWKENWEREGKRTANTYYLRNK